MSRVALPSIAIVAGLALAACGKDATVGLGPQPSDDTGVPDPFDSGVPDSGVAPLDATPVDFGFVADADFDSDGPVDTGFEGDGGDCPDGNCGTPEVGPGPDGGPEPDGGPLPDIGPMRDVGPIPDGAVPDAGGPQCMTDMDCGIFGVFGHCDPASNTCVECFDNAHCIGGGICDIAGGNVCRRPCFNGGCIGGDVCDPVLNACVDCLTNTDCGAGEVCDPTTHSCAECFADADCTLQPNQPFCDTAQNECVGCLIDGDCAVGETCYPTQGRFCGPATGRGLCDACDNDDECGGPDDLCIGYLGGPGGALFDRSCGTDCANGQTCPIGFECISVRQGSAQQCRPRYDMTTPTCTAHRNLGAECLYDPAQSDQGCGITGVQDARCIADSASSGVCTIFCADPDECPAGFGCATVGNQGVCL